MVDFYANFLGMQVTDRGEGDRIVFLSARPEVEHHELRSLADVRDLDPLGEPARDPAPASDREGPPGEGLLAGLLHRRIATELGVRELDLADVVRGDLSAEERRSHAVHAQHGA